ncbi:hypothetical protein [Microcystis aeruginosa]|uniref:hypothetical protein n=1 Tax=Microcystis aeruginosa TaxID=1126 RepID=UPI00232AF384|nr:hypothetical protein [Microcystis aeruginosa]
MECNPCHQSNFSSQLIRSIFQFDNAQIFAHFGEAMQPQILGVESEDSRQLGDLIRAW